MSNSVRPHRRQPTRLPHPWDSPGKNTGVGCHFLLQCMKMKSESEVESDSQRPHGLQPTRLLHPWDFPGKSTGVGCHCLLQVLPERRVNNERHSGRWLLESDLQISRFFAGHCGRSRDKGVALFWGLFTTSVITSALPCFIPLPIVMLRTHAQQWPR